MTGGGYAYYDAGTRGRIDAVIGALHRWRVAGSDTRAAVGEVRSTDEVTVSGRAGRTRKRVELAGSARARR